MHLTHEHEEIQRTLKRFIDEEINPHVDEWEAAEVAEAFEDLVRGESLGRLPFVDVRVDLFVDEALQRALDFFVFVGQVHQVSPCLEIRRGPRRIGPAATCAVRIRRTAPE